jgi:hypothetical protein
MAKVSGIPTSFTIDTTAGTPTDISDLIGQVTVNTSRALQDVTGLDKDGTERITLRGDYSIDITGFEDDSGRIDDIFLDPANQRDIVIVFPNRTFTGVCVIGSFNEQRNQDGSYAFTSNASQADGASLATTWS